MLRRVAVLGLACWMAGCSSQGGADGAVPGVPEGGRCGEGTARCEAELWCDPDPGRCGEEGVAGVCIRVPQICTHDYRPVCGCDGRTHGNECGRRAARAAKDRDGECG